MIEEEALALMQNVTKLKYSNEQLEIMRHTNGMCILACAGSGKTTTLTHLLIKKILCGEIRDTSKLLVTTYSVVGKNELQERINSLASTFKLKQKIEIRTLHSSFFKLLNDLGLVNNNSILDIWDRARCLRDAIKKIGIKSEDDILQKIDGILSYQINNMLSNKELEKHVVYDHDIPIEKYADIINCFQKYKYYYEEKYVKGNKNVESLSCKPIAPKIDYDDLQLMLYDYTIRGEQYTDSSDNINRVILDYCRGVWDYFYIDEFQDISKIQFYILNKLIRKKDSLIVIGDDDQCIYKWRGADPTIIQNIGKTYNIDTLKISTNYRCGEKIIELANNVIKNIIFNRLNKKMLSYTPGGMVRICDTGFGNYYDMSLVVMNKINELLNNGVEESDISILCRNNVHGSILSDMLFNYRILHRCSKEMKFSGTQIIRDIKVCIEFCYNTNNHNIIILNLWKFIKFIGNAYAYTLSRIMAEKYLDLTSLLKSYLMFNGVKIDDSIKYVDLYEYGNSINNLSSYINDNIFKLYEILNIKDIYERFNKLINLYVENTNEFLYNSIDNSRYLYSAIKYCKEIMTKEGIDGLYNHISQSEKFESIVIEDRRQTINLSTMHGAKGKEWKYVFMLGVDAYSCPNYKYIQESLENGIKIDYIYDYIDQERRLFYVAVTRAKNELNLICECSHISPFMLESIYGNIDPYQANNYVINWAKKNGEHGLNLSYEVEKACNDNNIVVGYERC